MTSFVSLIRHYWIVITIILLAFITLLSLTPIPNISLIPSNDKIQHFLAYGTLAFPLALRKPKHWLWIVLFFIFWSVGIELLQPHFHHRRDWFDVLANSVGVSCGTVFAVFINWVFPDNSKAI